MHSGQIIVVGQTAHLNSLAESLRQAGLPASAVPTLGLARVNHGAIVIFDDQLTDPVENARMVIDCEGHLLCLGPAAHDAATRTELAQRASDKGVILHEGVLATTDPCLGQIQSWISDGRLGQVISVHTEDYSGDKPASTRPVSWRHTAIASILMGQSPDTIRASSHAHDTAGSPTYSVCQLLTDSGPAGVLNRTTVHPVRHNRIVVVGEHATCTWIFTEDDESELRLHPGHGAAEIELTFGPDQHTSNLVEAIQSLDHESTAPFAHLNTGLSGLLDLINIAAISNEDISMVDEQTDYFVHPTTVVEGPVEIGAETRIWHFSKLLGPLSIGEKCSLGQNVVVERNVQIGDNVKIQNNVSVYSGVILEDDVFCGPSMVFTNVGTPRSAYPRKGQYLETRVRKGASIGANATVVCGNTLGEYCFVGAGSVVTRDVPSYALVYGNPARIRGWSCFCGERLPFGIGTEEKEKATCAECKRSYSRDGLMVKEQD